MLIAIGFDEQELEKLRTLGDVLAVSRDALGITLRDFIEKFPEGNYVKVDGSKIVIMHDIPGDKIGATMRSVRAVVDGHIIFATTTPTSLTWKISELIDELEEEDRYFRKRR
jgi:hypothetical protein